MEGYSKSAPIIARRLEGKVAIITGGASGIGAATARRFVKEGAKVVIADIQDELGHAVCKEAGGDEDISYVHCDVSKEADVQNLVDTTVSKHGKLDIMFNNAGFAKARDLQISAMEYDIFRKVFDVNVLGGLLGAKHAAGVMVPANKGCVLFTSSSCSVTQGFVPHVYAASKHAIVGMTKNLCVELGKYGIRVNCISPFAVATPMLIEGMGGIEKKAAEDIICKAANLKGTVLAAEDIAEAALYLASDESKYVSGMNLVVDGGYSTTNPSLEMTIKSMLS